MDVQNSVRLGTSQKILTLDQDDYCKLYPRDIIIEAYLFFVLLYNQTTKIISRDSTTANTIKSGSLMFLAKKYVMVDKSTIMIMNDTNIL